MIRRFYLFLGILLPLLLSACSEYGRILKSQDYNLKYEKAIEYYEKKQYNRALPLLEELIPVFRLTDKAEKTYYYFSYSHFHLKDYYLAAYYFKNFAKTFPASQYAEECLFMSGICNTRNSPDYPLDQKETYDAINELQLFLNRYPESSRRDTCNKIIDQLRHKLELKGFESANLYYKMENYKAASIAFKSFQESFPDSRYTELAAFLTVRADFLLAKNSIESKKLERYNETIKSYHNFVDFFANSPYRKEAESIHRSSIAEIEKLKKTKEP